MCFYGITICNLDIRKVLGGPLNALLKLVHNLYVYVDFGPDLTSVGKVITPVIYVILE